MSDRLTDAISQVTDADWIKRLDAVLTSEPMAFVRRLRRDRADFLSERNSARSKLGAARKTIRQLQADDLAAQTDIANLMASVTRLEAELAARDAERDALRAAVLDEIAARLTYQSLPVDRGGSQGPKGRAHAKWIECRAAVAAALGAS